MTGKYKGAHAETEACHFLLKQGLELLQKNYRCTCGEIDLIMQDNETIVFIEVRHRKHDSFGGPLESVTMSKQHKLIKTALFYMQKKRWLYKKICRFDVIGVRTNKKIEWVQNAFNIS